VELQPRTQRFEQVKAQLTDAILGGRFAPGDRLPSLRDLATHFHVSLSTIQRAVQYLEDEEWLVASSRRGVAVADPLPPVAHLLRLKRAQRDQPPPERRTPDLPITSSGRNGALRCLIPDETLAPLFEWAAREYAECYAPCGLKLEVRPLPGRDDEEAMRSLDADLILLSSYAASRAANVGSITPAEGMLADIPARFTGVPPRVMDLVSRDGRLWAAPVMAGGPVLVANEPACLRAGIDPTRIDSVPALLDALERAAAGQTGEVKLMNLTFFLMLLIAAGHEFPGVRGAPALLAHPEVRGILERLRALARDPRMFLIRFDQWERTDFRALAVRYQPSRAFCADAALRAGARVLPVPGHGRGLASMAAYCMCVSARSLHPFEAWEWAARLCGPDFQRRMAELGYDIPANSDPAVRSAFALAVGAANAGTLMDLAARSSPFYGQSPEDAMRYVWEILGNELYRFVSGQDDYARMIERVETKTDRFLQRAAMPDSPAVGGLPTPGAVRLAEAVAPV
jgi:DNA-binding transcriptional regulator YhcF (GntR family)